MSPLEACPSPSHRAALRLTGVALGGDIDERLLRDLEAADPVTLASIANMGHVHTLLYAARGRDPRLDLALPEDLWLYFDEMSRANAERTAEGRRELAYLGAACVEEGTEGIILKGGTALVDPGGAYVDRRFISDLDLLLREDIGKRLHHRLVTEGAGFTPFPEAMAPGMHHLPSLTLQGYDLPVEIHVRPGQPLVQKVLEADEIARCAEPTVLPGIAVPCEAHRYVHHVLHSAYDWHHLVQVYLRSLQDHHFYRGALPGAVARGQALLKRVSVDGHGQILSALTDVALGKDDTAAIRAQRTRLERALRDFGRPRKRQWSAAGEKVRRVARQLFTSPAYRRDLVKLLSDREALQASLVRHRNDIDSKR